MPKTPIIASSSASAAKATTSTARNRWRDVASRATSSSVMTPLTLTSCSLSTRPIAARTRRRQRLGRSRRRPDHQVDVVHAVLRQRDVDLHQLLGLVGPALHLPDDADDLPDVGVRLRSVSAERSATRRPIGDRPCEMRADQRFVDQADRHAVVPIAVGEAAAGDDRKIERLEVFGAHDLIVGSGPQMRCRPPGLRRSRRTDRRPPRCRAAACSPRPCSGRRAPP